MTDDFQTLVESLDLSDDDRETIVSVVGGGDVVDGNLVPRLDE